MMFGLLIKAGSAGGLSLLCLQFLPFLAPVVSTVQYLCCALLSEYQAAQKMVTLLTCVQSSGRQEI